MKYAALLVIASCVPDLDQRTSIVDRPMVLAIVAEPAEAKPGTSVTYQALVTSPMTLEWAYCTQPKPPTEDGAVSSACLDDPGLPIGTMPEDACMNFGPNPPGDGFRPRDPDPTGGFYQPIRVRGDAVITFGLQRISCDLANAPPDVVADYRARYPGQTIALHASWPADAAEAYVSYDLATVSLRDRRESLRVSFYATAGRFETDAAGVAEDDLATSIDDAWTAPAEAGTVTMWTVFRDSRGGASIATYSIAVQ